MWRGNVVRGGGGGIGCVQIGEGKKNGWTYYFNNITGDFRHKNLK
jgi:hypothetical protein